MEETWKPLYFVEINDERVGSIDLTGAAESKLTNVAEIQSGLAHEIKPSELIR